MSGLLALLYGTWRAMDAAFGVPAKEQYITGEWLQDWEHDQADQAVKALTVARWAFLGRGAADDSRRGDRLRVRLLQHRAPAR